MRKHLDSQGSEVTARLLSIARAAMMVTGFVPDVALSEHASIVRLPV